MADLELQVPQKVQRCLGDALLIGCGRRCRKEHQVHVTERGHLTTARAAQPHQRKPIRTGSVAREVERQADQLIVEEGGCLRRGVPISGLFGEPPRYFRATRGECVRQQRACVGVSVFAWANHRQAIRERAPVDDRTWLRDFCGAVRRHGQLFGTSEAYRPSPALSVRVTR